MSASEPIRVAVVVAQFVTGGTKSYIMNYCRNIDKKKVVFDFIVNNTSDGNYQEIFDLGGKVYEITPAIKNPIKNICETYKILKNNDYKIVHCFMNALNVFPLCAAWLARVSVRVSENLSTSHPSEKKNTVVKKMLRPFSTLFPTKLVANSELAAKWLFGNKECFILRNGIDLDKYAFDEELRLATRKQLGLTDEFVIGHIGRFNYQKNHNFLIDVFDEVHKVEPNSKLLLVGYGELKDAIDEKIDQLGLRDAVIDCGATEDIAKLYNAMDCFVLPSFYEGLPVVGVEAQACGLPCVFSSEITKEVKVTKNISFMNLSDDVSAWANQIVDYRGVRSNDKHSLRRAGYDIKEESKTLVEFYERLLE